ncbi:hypothetical protein RHABOEDO_001591 [Candidatus Rhabdochlamydia oedothoracis]|uniref:Transmembrane protein n=1 Tax=Candidatus Rhabdochlamydia oedothoracis TaxID=2720720 RepID=A0ABX8V7V6_9BACT|nr:MULTISPECIES: hypothetical protein [Rhabdochlamydia]KAG6559806.1 hypothetical protein RHOW815_000150 [Candidatus Rhabdochlamydia sp. W815]QYF49284.1 hypothetical protein RHABOEDO_001591 [Candidatus Rhabdochlamydia oedothoracis]
MSFINKCKPLSCDNYINAGNYFQQQLSNHSNLVVRTAFVFAKIVGRVQDLLIHAGLGSIKLIFSTAMAIYSIPSAAFDIIPIHHKVAKQASRHFGLALFFIADIPLSLANILKKYPQHLADKIQKNLIIENIMEEMDIEFDKTYPTEKQMIINSKSEKIQQLQEELSQTRENYDNLLQSCKEQVLEQIKKEGLQESKAS